MNSQPKNKKIDAKFQICAASGNKIKGETKLLFRWEKEPIFNFNIAHHQKKEDSNSTTQIKKTVKIKNKNASEKYFPITFTQLHLLVFAFGITMIIIMMMMIIEVSAVWTFFCCLEMKNSMSNKEMSATGKTNQQN